MLEGANQRTDSEPVFVPAEVANDRFKAVIFSRSDVRIGSTAARRFRDQDARQPTLKSGLWTAAIRLLTVTANSCRWRQAALRRVTLPCRSLCCHAGPERRMLDAVRHTAHDVALVEDPRSIVIAQVAAQNCASSRGRRRGVYAASRGDRAAGRVANADRSTCAAMTTLRFCNRPAAVALSATVLTTP